MSVSVLHIIKENKFWLHPHRCLFWEEESAIILSDLHLGKTGHFRKSGIAVPQNIYKEDLQRLVDIIQLFKPKKLIVTGDFFHSTANKELELFSKWRADFRTTEIHLIKGNHDILKAKWYADTNIILHDNHLNINGFCFTHDADDADCEHTTDYYFTGHIHPGVSIAGLGKQNLSFPCFHFTPKFAVLPAFSRFTGLAQIKKHKQNTVYAIVEKSIIKV